MAVNLLPLAAYQKIYQDFFRWSQWKSADPTSYNFDWYAGLGNVFGSVITSAIPSSNAYWKRDNMFSLRYCNWNKDLFMGMLPDSQFGDIAVVDVSPSQVTTSVVEGTSGHPINVGVALSGSSTANFISSTSPLTSGRPFRAYASPASFSILALRQAEALQKYREITQSVDTNYRDQIKAHFGVNVPASDSHMAQYIGGIARNLDISEVVNNNLQGDGEAVIYGKGVGTGGQHL